MKLYNSLTNHNLLEELKGGQIGVIPTDTIYGLVGSALNENTVERIYQVRKRDRNKPLVILISDVKNLKDFGVVLTDEQRKFLKRSWPGEVSVILPTTAQFDYLSCGTKGLAFRLPKDHRKLRQLLQLVGPLVAPSANPQGKTPAADVDEAITYFVDTVDFYVDGGKLENIASTLIDYTGVSPEIIRQGAVVVE